MKNNEFSLFELNTKRSNLPHLRFSRLCALNSIAEYYVNLVNEMNRVLHISSTIRCRWFVRMHPSSTECFVLTNYFAPHAA